jgi:hypothetical protein
MARSRRFHFSACSRRRGCPDGDAALGFDGRIGLDRSCPESCAETHKSLLKRLLLLAIQ